MVKLQDNRINKRITHKNDNQISVDFVEDTKSAMLTVSDRTKDRISHLQVQKSEKDWDCNLMMALAFTIGDMLNINHQTGV